MSKILKILALHEQGASINKIARDQMCSKSTVKARLDQLNEANLTTAKAKAMKPEELKKIILPPKRERMNYLEPDWDEIYLKANDRHRKKTLKALWEDYRQSTDTDATLKRLTYPAFCRAYKRYCEVLPPKMHLLRLTMHWNAGEVVMIDYAGDKMHLTDPATGKETPVNLFVAVLAHSGMIYCRPTLRQTRDEWIDSIAEMFTFYDGVTDAIYLDNSTSLVLKADRFNPKICSEFKALCEYYDTVANPVAPHEPTYKGLVENSVRQCTEKIIRPLRQRRFFDLGEMRIEVNKALEAINNAPMSDYIEQSRAERYAHEKTYLKKLPAQPYEPSLIVFDRKVQNGYCIRYEDCRYSVPYGYVGKTVRVHVHPRKGILDIYDRETGEKIASHPLSQKRGAVMIRREHMPKAHQYTCMTDTERVQELAVAGTHANDFALFLVRHEPKAIVYRHLQGLQNARKRLGDAGFNECCRRALTHIEIGYEAFTKEEDRMLNASVTKQKILAHGVRLELPESEENIRGENYYNDKDEANE